MRRVVWRCVAVVGVLCMFAPFAGCGSASGSSGDGGLSHAGGSAGQAISGGVRGASGGRIASSLVAEEDFLLKMNKSSAGTSQAMAQSQVAILKRAKANGGKVSLADYESAWSDFSRCMVNKGYTEPVTVRYPTGMRKLGLLGITNDAKSNKFMDDMNVCQSRYLINVDSIYGQQTGNPKLLSDNMAGAVDCMKRAGVVGDSYTVKQLNKDFDEYGKGKSVASVASPEAGACLAANRIAVSRGDEPVWHPFG